MGIIKKLSEFSPGKGKNGKIKQCKVCGIMAFAHLHHPGTLPKDFIKIPEKVEAVKETPPEKPESLLDEIAKNKSKIISEFCKAWLADTGLKPSEVQLEIQQNGFVDGKYSETYRMKKLTPSVPSDQSTPELEKEKKIVDYFSDRFMAENEYICKTTLTLGVFALCILSPYYLLLLILIWFPKD